MTSTQRANDSKQSSQRSKGKSRAQATVTHQPEATTSGPAAETPAVLQAAGSDPLSASPGSILALQRKFGNRAVSRLIQTKLTVGAANDQYEQEADHVARQVMTDSAAPIQRHHEAGKEDDDVQRKPLAAGITPLIQRHVLPSKGGDEEEKLEEEEEGSVQRRAATPTAGGFEAGAEVEQKLATNAGHGQALPDPVRGDMERRIGSDFSGVEVHTGSEAVQLNRDLNAQAFTHGNDIYFGAGKYNPAASEGKQLLAHELTHVVQQSGHIAPKRLQRKIRSPRQWWRDKEKKKQEGSYNIRMGQDLPETEEMGNKLIEERIEEERSNVMDHTSSEMNKREVALLIPLMLAKLDDGGFMSGVLKAYNGKAKTPVEASVLDDVGVALKKHGQTETDFYEAGTKAKDDLKKVMPKTLAAARIALVYEVQQQVTTLAKEQAKSTPVDPATPVYTSSDQSFLKGDPKQAAKRFWAIRQTYELNDAYLDKTQRKAFSAALKLMPTVQALLKPDSVAKDFRQTTGWKDGGSLVDKITVERDADKPGKDMRSPYQLLSKEKREQLNDRRANSKSFREKVQHVDRFTRMLVEPDLLGLVTRPTLHMHTAAAQALSSPWGYRANANKGFVNVSYNQDMKVIAHEVGHAIEGYLPLERWHDIHMLMGARHQAEGGGKAKAGATPIFTTLSEGRYAGKYVTGKYTSTAYKDGNAEVVSMAMEFFSEPKKAVKLVEGDPQHAAIVLRGFRPNEYASTDALRPFDKFIPHKKAKPPKPPKPSPEKIKAMKERMQKAKPLPPIPVKDKDTV